MNYRTVTTTPAERLLTGYAGQPLGLLVDNVETFEAAGGTIRTSASGRVEWAVLPDGSAYPVLCGDIVERTYEEGERYTDRCGAVATNRGACAGHGEARDAWRAMSEAERCAVERAEADADMWA